MLVVQRALIIIIRWGKVFFRFPTDSVQQFDILRGKTREKNRKFQDRINHLYISGSNNYFATAQLETILL